MPNPRYGDQNYWNERYVTSEESPFDWLCDFDQLRPTLEQLLRKDGLTLVVGCGDAPFSPDLYFRGNFVRTIHVDYSGVVIERQRRKYPEMDWREMDALNMPFQDNTFDAIIDKSLIDTTMCYQDGFETTKKLFAELHRVLKPGGRLLTVSLHTEDEIVRYRFSPAVSHCRLINKRKKPGAESNGKPQFHAMAVFDKLDGTSIDEKIRILDQHPIEIVGAMREDDDNEDDDDVRRLIPTTQRENSNSQDLAPGLERLSVSTESEPQPLPPRRQENGGGGGGDGGGDWDPKQEDALESAENIAQLMATVDGVLADLMRLHDKAKALARERAAEEAERRSQGSSFAELSTRTSSFASAKEQADEDGSH